MTLGMPTKTAEVFKAVVQFAKVGKTPTYKEVGDAVRATLETGAFAPLLYLAMVRKQTAHTSAFERHCSQRQNGTSWLRLYTPRSCIIGGRISRR